MVLALSKADSQSQCSIKALIGCDNVTAVNAMSVCIAL